MFAIIIVSSIVFVAKTSIVVFACIVFALLASIFCGVAATASDYLEEKALKHIWGIAAFAAPANYYIALSTANPGEDGTGLAEPAGGAYARVALTSANFTWNAGASRVENATDIVFPTATASWGTATHYAVFDAAGGGNMLMYAPLLSAKAIGNGDVPKFIAGTLSFTAD